MCFVIRTHGWIFSSDNVFCLSFSFLFNLRVCCVCAAEGNSDPEVIMVVVGIALLALDF